MSIIEIKVFAGAQMGAHLDAVADLRIHVLRDWPYLFAGDRAYAHRRLATYVESPRAVFVLAFDAERVVGAATGNPLRDAAYALQEPFRKRDIPIEDVFYFSESVLLAEYRGIGLGHRFFDERERHARRFGDYKMGAFCAVERALDDHRRPREHRTNDAFWLRRGYHRQIDMFSEIEWPVIGSDLPVRHRLRFWLRAFEPQ